MHQNEASTDFCSIVLLSYRTSLNDRDAIFKACMASLLDNTTYPYELILVDNTKNNRGFAAGRNFGASLATGKYIAFVDDDILFLPGWLETCIGLVEKGDKFIATPIIQRLIKKWELPRLDGIRRNSRTGSNCMVMRRSAFEDVGTFNTIYNTRLAGCNWANRVYRKGYTYLICDPPLARDLGVRKHSYSERTDI